MKRSRLLVAGVLAALVAWWGGSTWLGDPAPAAPATGPRPRTAGGLVEMMREARGRSASIPWTAPPRLDGAVTISGTVIDAVTSDGVGGVEVVFRNEAGEETTSAGPDGAYRIDLPLGTYRAFVRDDTVLSVGRTHVRLPGLPSADMAGVPDEALMPIIIASADADGVDLTVTRGGALRGKVVDGAGRAVANAVLRARMDSGMRPTLGTDVVETEADGTFELRLPAGTYGLEVSHPWFAGIAGDAALEIGPGDILTKTFTLVAGCVIAGRVVRPDGRPSSDGAIERRNAAEDEFAVAGRIAADGTFRWTTAEQAEVVLRAWPWKSPPSVAQTFACYNGGRYEHIVFALPDRGPDLEGVLLDPRGAPVANAYIDLAPLEEGGMAQQERTDQQGRWSVFALPPGRYRVSAHAAGHGVVSAVMTAPGAQIRLQFGGAGRLEGTAVSLANGSFELAFIACSDDHGYVPLPAEPRLVTVKNGRFTVEDAPACRLQMIATWHGHVTRGMADVPAGGTGHVELALGPPRSKVVHGTVRDASGRPADAVSVTAYFERATTRVTTDAKGDYRVRTFSGASLAAARVVGNLAQVGSGEVGIADVDEERVDLTLEVEDELGGEVED